MRSLNLSQLERIAREMLAVEYDFGDVAYETPELDIPGQAEAVPEMSSLKAQFPGQDSEQIDDILNMIRELDQTNKQQDKSIQVLDQIVNQDNMELENVKQRFDGLMYNIDDIYNTLDTYSEQMGKAVDKSIETKAAPANEPKTVEELTQPPEAANAPIPEKPVGSEVAPMEAAPAPAPEAEKSVTKPDFNIEPSPAQKAPVAPKTVAPKITAPKGQPKTTSPKAQPKTAPKSPKPNAPKPVEQTVAPKVEQQVADLTKDLGDVEAIPPGQEDLYDQVLQDIGETTAPEAPKSAPPKAPVIAPKNLKNEGLAPDTSKYVKPELQNDIEQAISSLYQGKGLKPYDVLQSLGKGANPKEVLYTMNDMVSKGQLAKDSKGNFVPAGDASAVEAAPKAEKPAEQPPAEGAAPKRGPGRPKKEKPIAPEPAPEETAPETEKTPVEAKPSIEPEKLGPAIEQAVKTLFKGKGLTSKQIEDEIAKDYSVDPKDIGRKIRDMRAEGQIDTVDRGLIVPKKKAPKDESQPPELTNALVDFVKENPGKEISEVYKIIENDPRFAEIMNSLRDAGNTSASVPQALADLTNAGKLKRDNKNRLTVQAFVQKLEKTGKIVVINDRLYPF